MSNLLAGEAIGKGGRMIAAPWHWVKRRSARKMRRMAKALGEDAPQKARYSGWVA